MKVDIVPVTPQPWQLVERLFAAKATTTVDRPSARSRRPRRHEPDRAEDVMREVDPDRPRAHTSATGLRRHPGP